jgi:hypothetical protein
MTMSQAMRFLVTASNSFSDVGDASPCHQSKKVAGTPPKSLGKHQRRPSIGAPSHAGIRHRPNDIVRPLLGALAANIPRMRQGENCPLGQSQPDRIDAGCLVNSVAAIERCGP